MSWIDSFLQLFGVKRPKAESIAGLATEPQCPHEAEILSYSEGKLSDRRRTQLETHFTSCDDCRSLLVLLARFNDAITESPDPLSESALRNQTARVLAYIENDESKRRQKARESAKQELLPRRKEGFIVSYSQLATVGLLFCAIVVSGIYWFTRGEKPEEAAMQHLAMAMKHERRSETRISGGLDYSPYIATRGAEDNENLALKRAWNKLKFAENENAPVQARLALVRVHLAFEKQEHARQALLILQQLVSAGVKSPEASNDLGVAQFQLEKYEESLANFARALEQKPDYPEALFNKALAEQRAGHQEEAKRDWQEFINRSSDPNWKREAEDNLSLLLAPPNP